MSIYLSAIEVQKSFWNENYIFWILFNRDFDLFSIESLRLGLSTISELALIKLKRFSTHRHNYKPY